MPAPEPRLVFLFSGHMVDAPGRAVARFPAGRERAAAEAVGAALDRLGAGPDDLALTQGASGGDILFIEACQARGVPVRLLLPLPEPEFVARSLLPSADGERWRARYFAAKARLDEAPRVLPPLPPLPQQPAAPPSAPVAGTDAPDADQSDPFIRCNQWLLDTAFSWGGGRLRFVCLWDGSGGDGRGGTAHICGEVVRRGGQVNWIDIRTLSGEN